MATVAKSDHVFDGMNRNVELLFKNRLEAAQADYSGYTQEQLGDLVYSLLVDDQLLDTLLKIWDQPMLMGIDYWGKSVHTHKYADKVVICTAADTYALPMTQNRLVPHCLAPNGYGGINISLQPELATKMAPFITVMETREEKIKAVKTARDSLLTQLKSIWNQVSTVNQLIKVWPQAEHLLQNVTTYSGARVLDKIREKTERTTVKKLMGEIDTHALNTELLMAKVAK